MMYEEFIALLNSDEVTYNEYHEKIEPVYMWHPLFEDGGLQAKNRVVNLYRMGGIAIFEDLNVTAEKFRALEDELVEAKRVADEANAEYERLLDKRMEAVKRYVRNSSK